MKNNRDSIRIELRLTLYSLFVGYEKTIEFNTLAFVFFIDYSQALDAVQITYLV